MSIDRKLVFFLYDNRSGSTLLASLINQMEGIGVTLENGLVPIVMEHLSSIKSEHDIEAIVKELYSEVQFRELGIERSRLKEALVKLPRPVSKRDFILATLDLYFGLRDPDARMWIVKGPRMYFHIARVLEWFPNAVFIHIYRDGRAVFNSKKSMRSVDGLYPDRNLIHAARDWVQRLKIANSLGNVVCHIRFEDMAADPVKTLNQVSDFLMLSEIERRITKEQSVYAMSIGQAQRHLHTNVAGKPRKEVGDKWKSELSEVDICLYERLVAKELQACGYKLVGDSLANPPSALKLVMRFHFYCLQFILIKVENLFHYAFVSRSLWKRVKAKVFEHV
jgi:hypothetical protein